MDVSDNILTAGLALRKVILGIPGLGTDRIFPISVRVEQPMPFVTFFRSLLEEDAVKAQEGPRTAHFVVQIYSGEWSQGVDIASRIASYLDGYRDDHITICRLEDAVENFDPTIPAYVQILSFKVKK